MTQRMERVCYTVSSNHGDEWTVAVADEPPLRFEQQDLAIAAAAGAARELWERYGVSSCVNVVGVDGECEQAFEFGGAADSK